MEGVTAGETAFKAGCSSEEECWFRIPEVGFAKYPTQTRRTLAPGPEGASVVEVRKAEPLGRPFVGVTDRRDGPLPGCGETVSRCFWKAETASPTLAIQTRRHRITWDLPLIGGLAFRGPACVYRCAITLILLTVGKDRRMFR